MRAPRTLTLTLTLPLTLNLTPTLTLTLTLTLTPTLTPTLELELASTARRAPFHPSAAGVLRVLLERGLLERVFGFIEDRPPRLTFITDIA